MGNTYTQIHIHAVFAVKYRDALIRNSWSENLKKYISAIVRDNDHKVLAVNNMEDHFHLFFGMRTHQSIADLMRIVKGESSEWINNNKFCRSKFRWQEGYGAFSYCRDKVNTVIDYVRNQQLHHENKSFLVEYRELLEEFGIEYDPKYIFHELV
jgi:putative transposase